MNLEVCKEEAGATSLLTKASLSTKSVPSSRQVESARLLKLMPDLSQKEVIRLVAVLIRWRKRDADVTGKRWEKPLARNIPAIFPKKRSMQKLCSPEVTHNQLAKLRCLPELLLYRSTTRSGCYRKWEPKAI